MLPGYAELHCISNFTFLRGASHPEELVMQAAELGYKALAITDECSMAGIVRAYIKAKELNLKLLIGSEFKFQEGIKLLLIAKTMNGYGNLCELITLARSRAKKGEYRINKADLENGLPNCLAIWCADESSSIEDAAWLKKRFTDNCWIAVELLREKDDQAYLAKMRRFSEITNIKLVAAGDVHMHTRKRQPLQDTLTCIRHTIPMAEAGTALYKNAERHLRSIGRISNIYPIDLLMETLAIVDCCQFSLDELRYEYPEEIVPKSKTPTDYLAELAWQGANRRYPNGIPEKVEKLLTYELALIKELRYEAFFLTVYDIVSFARSQNILCQGRGSAANSVVCYCIGVTEVNPEKSEVLFERFISKERNEPPDIDVDFEHERRNEVIQYIYEKYGRDRVAIAAAVSTYHTRGALRDIGKVLGFSLDQLDSLAKIMAWWDSRAQLLTKLTEAGFDPNSTQIQHLVSLVNQIVHFPRHLSQHSGGFVIENRKLSRLVPIEPTAMPERTAIQWDKDDLDAIGLLKVDILALGMLTCVRKAFDLINGFHGTNIGMKDIAGGEDQKVYRMLWNADTIGVFQVESRAQMSMLPILKPKKFYDLVVQVAIVRPGPIQGKMVHPYLMRRQQKEKVTYPSQAIEHILERTLGVAIFQEQVMAISIAAAGFTPGEADQLRRAMAAWKRKGGIEPFREKLVKGMLERGYTQEFSEQIFQMMKGFGEYGFPESHSASFALLVYISSWIKHYEPAAFAAALINSQPMGFYSPSQIIQDAKRHGVEIYPVDVMTSEWYCTLERTKNNRPALRLGFCRVKGLSQQAVDKIVKEREKSNFESVQDLVARTQIRKPDIDSLAKADALQALVGHRRNALWHSLGASHAIGTLALKQQQSAIPYLAAPKEGEEIISDYAQIGLSLRRHPLAVLRPYLSSMRLLNANQLRVARSGQLVRTMGLVTCRQRPGTATGVIFITLEDETGWINVVLWSDLAEKQRKEWIHSRLLAVYGRLERKGQVAHLIAGRLVDYSHMLGQLEVDSRNFH